MSPNPETVPDGLSRIADALERLATVAEYRWASLREWRPQVTIVDANEQVEAVPMPNRTVRRHSEPSELALSTQDLIRRRKLWPTHEAARLLGVSRPTLYRWEDEGRIRFIRIDGRTLVADAELDRFVARAEAAS